jgi:mannosyltransferase
VVSLERSLPRTELRRTVLLGLIICLAFGLRLFRLGHQELRGDEAFGVLFSVQSVRGVISETLRNLEPHPPLDYVFLGGWMGIAGDSEFAVRFPSAVAGVLTVAMAYALARQTLGQVAGLWASAFLAINPFQVWHAQESRMYAISTALAMATMLVLWLALNQGGWYRWATYALLTVVHLYLHYYAFFIVLAQTAFVLAFLRRHRSQLAGFLAAGMGVLLLYLPWLVLGWQVILTYHGNGDSPGFAEMLIRTLRAFSLGESIPPTAAAPFLLAFGLLIGVGVWHAIRTRGREALFLGLWLAVPLAGVWLASLRRPVFNERYIIAASPAFYLFLGAGAAWLATQRRWAQAFLGLLVAGCLVGSVISLYNHHMVPEYSKTAGWRKVADYLSNHEQMGDALVQNYPDPALAYYVSGTLPQYVLPRQANARPERTAQALEELLAKYNRLWFLPYPSSEWDSGGMVEKWLGRNAELTDDVQLGNIHLLAYLPPRVSLAQMTPKEARLGDAFLLRGYRLEGRPQPGDLLKLTLYWEALEPVDTNYSVFVHLSDSADRIWGQHDGQPMNGTHPTGDWTPGEIVIDQHSVRLDPETPVGRYHLLVGMYDGTDGQRLTFTGSSDIVSDDRLVLEIVNVAETVGSGPGQGE